MSSSALFVYVFFAVCAAFALYVMLDELFIKRLKRLRRRREEELDEVEEYANDPYDPKWGQSKWREP